MFARRFTEGAFVALYQRRRAGAPAAATAWPWAGRRDTVNELL
jgi:hypothetical protein